jgi:hypothetical protein
MPHRRLTDRIAALRETALDLPGGTELTQVLIWLRDAEHEESQRLRERLQHALPERRSLSDPPKTINGKIAMIMGALRK